MLDIAKIHTGRDVATVIKCKRKDLKWLLEKCCFIHVLNSRIHLSDFSRVKETLLWKSAICLLASTNLMWIIGLRLILSKQQPIKRNVMSSRNVSRGRVPACDNQS